MSPLEPSQTLLPPATLGVLGGGQLGRMFVHAAQQLGYRTVVLDPEPASPAGTVAHQHLEAAHLDEDALDALAECADAVTTEFENVPAAALVRLADQVRVAPSGEALARCQDRALEKAHFEGCGVATAPYAVITGSDDLATVDERLLPGILKTATQGYDGKGQARVATRDELEQAFRDLGEVRCVLERRLDLAYEVSVIVARGADGQVVMLPLQENVHVDGILATTTVPAPSATPQIEADAQQAARLIATALDFVGVLCVEFFVLADGSLVANEMAPRPHNSGHYSIDACDISQFELQVRALAGLPLGEPRLLAPAVMINLLGDLWISESGAVREPDWPSVLSLPGVHLHLYGKSDPRAGRKMGHLTITGGSAEVTQAAAAALGINTVR